MKENKIKTKCKMDFYFSWYGNKRREIENFVKYIDFNKYETFVEPFGGSLAFSRYVFNMYPKKTFVIGDNDENLTRFCNNFYMYKNEVINDVKNLSEDLTKEKFNEIIQQPYPENLHDFMVQYLFYQSVNGIRKGMYPSNNRVCKFHKYNQRTKITDEFFMRNTYEHQEFHELLDKVKYDEKAFVFLDPPYPIDSECKYYNDNNVMRIWSYLIDFINNCKCSFIMILNSNVFMDVIFKDFIVGRYHKRYETNSKNKNIEGKFIKKQTNHLIISNIPVMNESGVLL